MYRAVVLLGGWVGLTGCPGGTQARVDKVLELSGDAVAGEQSYVQLCDTCHKADGMGGDSFPDITAYQGDDSAYLTVMIEGPGGMPAFGSQTDQVLADILAYSRATF